MDAPLYTLETDSPLDLPSFTRNNLLTALESGQVVYFPAYTFALQPQEETVLTESILKKGRKNISYDYQHHRLSGLADSAVSHATAQAMMHRFAEFAKQLISKTIPAYEDALIWGRTSYRPAEIKGRKTSKLKDDTRLHVDAFPSTPVNGLRILRVFCNINPYQEPRVWHLGEPFEKVLKAFYPKLPAYRPWQANMLTWIKATKTLRSAYDHYMLHLHNRMKLDDQYQAQVRKHRMDFPANSTWIVFTDHVSHAALSGQFLLEQTFYLPVAAMAHPAHSPLHQLKRRTTQTERVAEII